MYLPCLHNLRVPGQVLLATACCFTKHGALSQSAGQPASQPTTTAAGAWWHGAHHCPDPLPQTAVRPAMPTTMCSPGQGWVSTQCLALSMAACKPLFLPECQSTFRPQLLFSLPPFFSLPATGSGSASSSVCFWFSCSWLLVPSLPSSVLSLPRVQMENSCSLELCKSLLLFSEAAWSNPAPRAGSSSPATPAKMRALGPRLGAHFTL